MTTTEPIPAGWTGEPLFDEHAVAPVAPAPGTPEWARLVTASKVAAILGLSPWDSPRSIWHVIRGDVSSDDGRNRDVKSRGHYLEAGILDWWHDQHPEFGHVERQHYATRPDLPWAASTPDAAGWEGHRAPAFGHAPDAIVDAKTARDDDEWGRPGTDEIPAYYAAQLLWGMHLSGARRAYIALLTQRLDLREYVLDYDAETAENVERICAEFWQSTLDDTPPELDDSVATFDVMRRLHPDIARDAVHELDRPDALALVEAVANTKRAEAVERHLRSHLLEQMGDARRAVCDGVPVARRQGGKGGRVSLVVTATPDHLPTTTPNDQEA